MAVYAIADLHLSFGADKPMDVFSGWNDHAQRLEKNWRTLGEEGDTVILPGEISWGMALEQAGADVLDLSAGTEDYRDVPGEFPLDGRIYAASLVKRQVRVPVICVGNIVSKEQAEQAFFTGYVVAVGRGHLCDPAWM